MPGAIFGEGLLSRQEKNLQEFHTSVGKELHPNLWELVGIRNDFKVTRKPRWACSRRRRYLRTHFPAHASTLTLSHQSRKRRKTLTILVISAPPDRIRWSTTTVPRRFIHFFHRGRGIFASIIYTKLLYSKYSLQAHLLQAQSRYRHQNSRVPTFPRQNVFVIGTSTPRYGHTKNHFVPITSCDVIHNADVSGYWGGE